MSKVVVPVAPNEAWLQSFLKAGLANTPAFSLKPHDVDIKLDQNESPYDLPLSLKEKVAAELVKVPWNRYPSPYSPEVEDVVARYARLEHGSILLGPGSNYLLSVLISTFAGKIEGDLYIARPSFPLYEAHCRYEEIPYEPWLLNSELEYEPETLSTMPAGSMVIFASPNNPVGNALRRSTLKELLIQHPRSLFVADEAYYEFSDEPYTELLADHGNLILVRTFSKTLGCAGLRVGYIAGHRDYVAQLRKLRLPFLLNHFSTVALQTILSDPQTNEYLAGVIANVREQRAVVMAELKRLGPEVGFRVKPTEANFLLCRFAAEGGAKRAWAHLVEDGILVRDVSKGPGLAGCLRVTLGTAEQNQRICESFSRLAGGS